MRDTTASTNTVVPQVREYVWPVMGTKEFCMRSVHQDEFDVMIAEMKKQSLREDDGGIFDGDTHSCSTDDDDIYIEDEHEQLEGADDTDDRSLTESYIRSGTLSGGFEEPDVEETPVGADEHKKRVRFATDPKGKMLCQRYNNYNPIRRCEKKLIWYRKSDFKKFRKEGQTEAVVARMSSFAKDFQRVYESCSSLETLKALTEKHTLVVSESKYRGYEAVVFYSTLQTVRKASRKQILQMQQQHVCCNFMTPEERAEELGAKARALSKKSRRLAYVLGSGDAAVARKALSKNEVEKILSYSFMHWSPSPNFSDTLKHLDTMCEI